MIARPANLAFRAAPRKAGVKRLGIVFHHTAGNPRNTIQIEHKGHLNRGWIGIGYHFFQDIDGNWWIGRPYDTEGAHATSYNRTHIGVVVAGNFDIVEFPDMRRESLLDMLEKISRDEKFEAYASWGHKEVPGANTVCPGRYIHCGDLRRDLAARLMRTIHPTPTRVWGYRHLVNGKQRGTFTNPTLSVLAALKEKPDLIELQRILINV